jgi:hypothetical protein
MLFIFLEGVQIMPSNHLECYLFLEGVQIMPSNHCTPSKKKNNIVNDFMA